MELVTNWGWMTARTWVANAVRKKLTGSAQKVTMTVLIVKCNQGTVHLAYIGELAGQQHH